MAFDSGVLLTPERIWEIYQFKGTAYSKNDKERYDIMKKQIEELNAYSTLCELSKGISQSITWAENPNKAILDLMSHTIKVHKKKMEKKEQEKKARLCYDIIYWKVEKLGNGCYTVKRGHYRDEKLQRVETCSLVKNSCFNFGNETTKCNHSPTYFGALKKILKECNTIPEETLQEWKAEYDQEQEKLRQREERRRQQQLEEQKQYNDAVNATFQKLIQHK